MTEDNQDPSITGIVDKAGACIRSIESYVAMRNKLMEVIDGSEQSKIVITFKSAQDDTFYSDYGVDLNDFDPDTRDVIGMALLEHLEKSVYKAWRDLKLVVDLGNQAITDAINEPAPDTIPFQTTPQLYEESNDDE